MKMMRWKLGRNLLFGLIILSCLFFAPVLAFGNCFDNYKAFPGLSTYVFLPRVEEGSYHTLAEFFPEGSEVMIDGDIETQGLLIAATGRNIYLQRGQGASEWDVVATMPAPMTPQFIHFSPDGSKIALGPRYGDSLLVFPTAILSVDEPPLLTEDESVIQFDCIGEYYDGDWLDNRYFVLGFVNVPPCDYWWSNPECNIEGVVGSVDTEVEDPSTHLGSLLIHNIPGIPGDVEIDSNGNLITGIGFSHSGRGGEIKVWAPDEWDPVNGSNLDYEANSKIVSQNLLSAGFIGEDHEGNLHVGAGIKSFEHDAQFAYNGPTEHGYAALIREGIVNDIATGARTIPVSDGDRSDNYEYKYFPPDNCQDDTVTPIIADHSGRRLAVMLNFDDDDCASSEKGSSGHYWNPGCQPVLVIFPGYPSGNNKGYQPYTMAEGVNVATGNLFRTQNDIRSGATPMSPSFSRYYNSQDGFEGVLGAGWRHTYDRSLSISPVTITAFRPTGRIITFNAVTLQPMSDAKEHLLFDETSGQYTLITTDQKKETYDAGGRLISITDRNDNQQTLVYQNDRLHEVIGPFGRTLSFGYDEYGRLVTVTDPAGRDVVFAYDAPDPGSTGNLVRVTHPINAGESRIRKYLYEDEYDSHNLTGITDTIDGVDRQVQDFSYDAMDRATRVSYDGDTSLFDFTYQADGEPDKTSVTDIEGHAATYTFSNIQGIYRSNAIMGPDLTGTGNYEQLFSWDPDTLNLTSREKRGIATTYSDYDEWGNAGTIIEAPGDPEHERTITRQFDPEINRVTRITTASTTAGEYHRIVYEYDSAGHGNPEIIRETGISDGEVITRVTTVEYNNRGQLISGNGPGAGNDIYTWNYDPVTGNLISQTAPLSGTVSYAGHDAFGSPQSITDGNNIVTTVTYDYRGRIKSREIDGALTTYEYREDGKLLQTTDPTGVALFYEYDETGRLSRTLDGDGNRIELTLNSEGQPLRKEIFNPEGTSVRYLERTYDAYSRPVSETDVHGARYFGYDDDTGRLTSVTDPMGRITTYEYDALGRRKKIVEPAPESGGSLPQTLFTYDNRDNLVSVTDAEGRTITSVYDDFGQCIEQNSPDSGLTRNTYDIPGNITSRTDANGVTTHYSYDAENRVTAIDYPGTDHDVTFTYDQGENGMGRRTGMVDASGTYTYTYDVRGHLTTEKKVIDNATYYVRYGYDAAGRLTSITYPDGMVVMYNRDAVGNVVGIEAISNGVSRTVLSDVVHMPFGPIADMVFGNGLETEFGIDQSYRISDISTGTIQDITLDRNPSGNVDAITDLLDPSKNRSFSFDNLERLVESTGVYGTIQYDHDLTGNRTEKVESAGTQNYSYDPGTSRLIELEGVDPYVLTLDAVGNTLTIGNKALNYNSENRLIGVTQSGEPDIAYKYDALGRRVKKSVGDTETIYHYDPDGRLIAEHDPDTSRWISYIYLGGSPVAMVRNSPDDVVRCTGDCDGDSAVTISDYILFRNDYGRTDCSADEPCVGDLNGDGAVTFLDFNLFRNDYGRTSCPLKSIYFYHNDHLGTPQKMTDETGTVVWAADYLPFGGADVTVETIENNLRFPGQYYDSETGLHYNWNRYYDPALGRYLRADPIGLSGGINFYAYCSNNPLNYTDPTGHNEQVLNSNWLELFIGDIPTAFAHLGESLSRFFNREGRGGDVNAADSFSSDATLIGAGGPGEMDVYMLDEIVVHGSPDNSLNITIPLIGRSQLVYELPIGGLLPETLVASGRVMGLAASLPFLLSGDAPRNNRSQPIPADDYFDDDDACMTWYNELSAVRDKIMNSSGCRDPLIRQAFNEGARNYNSTCAPMGYPILPLIPFIP